jgi:hypothetical protein
VRVREVRIREELALSLASRNAVSSHASKPSWLSVMVPPANVNSGSNGHDPKGGGTNLPVDIRERYSLSLGSYGRLRMAMELKEAGHDVAERRIGWLIRHNRIELVGIRQKKRSHRQSPPLGCSCEPTGQGFCRSSTKPEVSGRHHLCLDIRRLVLPRYHRYAKPCAYAHLS